ncbi:hypothetical protein P9112_000924 [Eukaryota sp. TZLM1-RC]
MYLCRNCSSGQVDRTISKDEQLCLECLKKLRRVFCDYCHIDFHETESEAAIKDSTLCFRCRENQLLFQCKPHACCYCGCKSVFQSEICFYCEYQQSKYGHPFPCAECSTVSAFRRSPDTPDEQLLCLLCTRKRKLMERSQKRRHKNSDGPAEKRLREELVTMTPLEADACISKLQRSYEQRLRNADILLAQEKQELNSQIIDLRKQLANKTQECEKLDVQLVKAKNKVFELEGKIKYMEAEHKRELECTESHIYAERLYDLQSENARLKAQLLKYGK